MVRFELIRVEDGSRKKICEVEETSPEEWTLRKLRHHHIQENLSDIGAAESIFECMEDELVRIREAFV
jgi:hypothetical protein